MVTLLLPLNGDVETHGNVVGAPTAWEAIDEDPSDGDTTRIRINNVGAVEASSIDASALPLGAEVAAVRVRWEASGSTDINDPSFGQAGVRINGVDYFAAARMLSPGVYGGAFTETFSLNPSTGGTWSAGHVAICQPIWRLESGAPQIQQPRLTQRVLYVDYEPGAFRLEATGEGNAPRAHTTSILGCSAVPSSNAPQAVPSSTAPEASGASSGPEGSVI